MADPFAKSATAGRRKLIIGIASAILAVCAIGYFVASGGKGTVIVQYDTPTGITITLNDQPVEVRKDTDGLHISAYPGQYRLKITRTDYLPFIQDITVSRGSSVTVRPAFALIPKQSGDASSMTVQFVQPTEDGQTILYLGNGGATLYQMDLSTQVPLPITTQNLSGVTDIQWSAQPDVALVLKRDGAYLQEVPTYNFRTQAIRKIAGPEFEAAAWDPLDSSRLAVAYYAPGGESSLIFSDKTGVPGDRKADLTGIEKAKLVWSPDSRYIAVIGRSADQSKNHLWLYGLTDGSFVQLSPDSGAVDASFAPDGSTILYERVGSTLKTIGTDGSDQKEVGLVGHAAQAAWHDSSSFFLPSSADSSLVLHSLGGGNQELAYTFTDPTQVQGMYYFPTGNKLLFFTRSTLYTINVGL